MIANADEIQSTLGCDVAKDTVTLFDSRTLKTLTVSNTTAALKAALKPYAGRTGMLAICEATGGYEDELLRVLESLAIPAHRADAARVKAFIRSCGTMAKTDPIDARHIAEYGLLRAKSLPRFQAPEPQDARMKLLVARRADLVAMRVQEENRLKAPRNKPIAREIAGHVAEIKRRIDAIDRQIEATVSGNRRMKERQAILRGVPGIGKVIAPVLLALMPELGRIDRRQAASLAGCAPHPRDSGTYKGRRFATGGRRQLRPLLFTAAMAASHSKSHLAVIYRRLLAAGKSKMTALGALMRHIVVIANARLKEYEAADARLT
ncbi:IS110 family transposase [Pararhizobium sp. O133]|uniref:IS110 family transposase n=1 Tax=Pararhizobium sp. O133 TaxID=3449278 RepID=UPI003F686A33